MAIPAQSDSWYLSSLRSEQDMCPNPVAIGWAMHGVDALAKAVGHKGNQTLCNPLSMKPSRRIVCATVVVLAQWIQPVARVETDRVWFRYKIHQT